MGFTRLARWINAPSTGLQLIQEKLVLNHQATCRGKWNITLKSYRSTLGHQIPGPSVQFERIMYTISMEENVFVILEDPAAPTKLDVLSAAPSGQEIPYLQNPSHYRSTFVTIQPPGGIEQLLSQAKAGWVPVRHASSANNPRAQLFAGGQQLSVDGQVFSIGTDWLVRIGHVVLASGVVKGIIIEAEYLPLPVLQSSSTDGSADLLSNLLASILPNNKDARTVLVTVTDEQWEEFLWDREEEVTKRLEGKQDDVSEDDPYAWDNDGEEGWKPNDWVGIDRERRSAFLILGALRLENLV